MVILDRYIMADRTPFNGISYGNVKTAALSHTEIYLILTYSALECIIIVQSRDAQKAVNPTVSGNRKSGVLYR